MAIINIDPGANLQAEIASAPAGSEIRCSPGDYEGLSGQSGYGIYIDKEIHLISVDGSDNPSFGTARIFITQNSKATVVGFVPGSAGGGITGFEVEGGSQNGIQFWDVDSYADYNEVHNIDNISSSVSTYGISGINTGSAVRNCRIHGNKIYDVGRVPSPSEPFTYGNDWGLYLKGAGHIVTCNLMGSFQSGAAIKWGEWNGTPPNTSNADTLCANNTFFQYCRGGSRGQHNSHYSNDGNNFTRPGVVYIGNAYARNAMFDGNPGPASAIGDTCISMAVLNNSNPGPHTKFFGQFTSTAQIIPTAEQVNNPQYLPDITDPDVYAGNMVSGSVEAAWVNASEDPATWDATPKSGSPLIGLAPWSDPSGTFTLPLVDMNGQAFVNRSGTRTAGAVEFISEDYPMGTFSKNGVIPAAAISGNVQTAASGTLPACAQFRLTTPDATGTVIINGVSYPFSGREQIIDSTSGGSYSGLPAGSTLVPLGTPITGMTFDPAVGIDVVNGTVPKELTDVTVIGGVAPYTYTVAEPDNDFDGNTLRRLVPWQYIGTKITPLPWRMLKGRLTRLCSIPKFQAPYQFFSPRHPY